MKVNYKKFINAIKNGASNAVDTATPIGIAKSIKGYRKDKAGEKKSKEDLEKIRLKKRQFDLKRSTENYRKMKKKTNDKKLDPTKSAPGKPGYDYKKWD